MKTTKTQFKNAQDAHARIKTAISAVATAERSWLNRLEELDNLSLEAMTKAFEDADAEPDLSDIRQAGSGKDTD